MVVERRVLRSISELSMFKYLLVFYLIFFILSVIGLGIAALIGWATLASSGLGINDVLGLVGLDNLGINNIFGGGTLGIVIAIIIGLVASVLYAAVGTLVVWIMNVILRISGGIEIRFLEKSEEAKETDN
jgi:hypothetical protein